MIGILLLSHGNICEGALHSAEVILGKIPNVKAIPLQGTDNVDEFQSEVISSIDELDEGEGVIVMVDVMGGTPFNRTASIFKQKNIAIVTGLSLPMLITAIEGRSIYKALNEVKNYCIDGAVNGIKDIESIIK